MMGILNYVDGVHHKSAGEKEVVCCTVEWIRKGPIVENVGKHHELFTKVNFMSFCHSQSYCTVI